MLAVCVIVLHPGVAAADPGVPTAPDVSPRTEPAAIPPANFRPTSDLDGIYIWLGPSIAAGRVIDRWDSVVGADLSVLRVREHRLLGTIGGNVGGGRWTELGGGRVWLDAVAGTRVAGHMVGVTAGPQLELSDFTHPRFGGSVGVWGFAGVTPYVRVGDINNLGWFAEIGVHIMLPVLRR